MKVSLLFMLCVVLVACGRTAFTPSLGLPNEPSHGSDVSLPSARLSPADNVFLEQAEILSYYPSTVDMETFRDQLEKVWAAWDLVCVEAHAIKGKEEFTLAMLEWNQIMLEWNDREKSLNRRMASAATRFEIGRKIATEK